MAQRLSEPATAIVTYRLRKSTVQNFVRNSDQGTPATGLGYMVNVQQKSGYGFQHGDHETQSSPALNAIW